MVKMSHTRWSVLSEEEDRGNVTLMDREVAAGWFDKWRPDLDFRFRAFTHNVPNRDSRVGRDSEIQEWSEDGLSSSRSSHSDLDRSIQSSVIQSSVSISKD